MDFSHRIISKYAKHQLAGLWRNTLFQNLLIQVYSLSKQALPLSYIHNMALMPHYHVDVRLATRFMACTNTINKAKIADIDPQLIAKAVKFNYLAWPRKIITHIHGQDVLDVGCGTGIHSIGYVVAGVKSYTGLDPKIDFTNDRSKNLRTRHWERFGWTPNDIMQQIPHVNFISGTFENIAPQDNFDMVVLHNVTEHLLNIEEVFDGIAQRLRPGGRLLYNHHNFYAWNGHHQPPKTVHDIDPDDPFQRELIDWKHVATFDCQTDALSKKLNKIRIKELKLLTQKFFKIEQWSEVPIKPENGLFRFTDEILRAHPRFTKTELLTQHVFCIASLKDH